MSPYYFAEVTYLGRQKSDDRYARSDYIYDVLKRVIDLCLASALLVIVSPLILIAALLIYWDGGKPFYAHWRIGRDGKAFPCWKLRTMHHDSDAKLARLLQSNPCAAKEWQTKQKLSNDPRVTDIGRILRRTSFDELPQFWNVIRGQLSLVGPRPVTEEELLRYGAVANLYLRHRPGVTGPWQVGARNQTDFITRIGMDRDYLLTPSLWVDLKLIAQTPLAMIRKTGV